MASHRIGEPRFSFLEAPACLSPPRDRSTKQSKNLPLGRDEWSPPIKKRYKGHYHMSCPRSATASWSPSVRWRTTRSSTRFHTQQLWHICINMAQKLYIYCNLLVFSNVTNNGWKVVEMCEKKGIDLFSKILNMFVWTSGFQKSLSHTDFNMFVDQC